MGNDSAMGTWHQGIRPQYVGPVPFVSKRSRTSLIDEKITDALWRNSLWNFIIVSCWPLVCASNCVCWAAFESLKTWWGGNTINSEFCAFHAVGTVASLDYCWSFFLVEDPKLLSVDHNPGHFDVNNSSSQNNRPRNGRWDVFLQSEQLLCLQIETRVL